MIKKVDMLEPINSNSPFIIKVIWAEEVKRVLDELVDKVNSLDRNVGSDVI